MGSSAQAKICFGVAFEEGFEFPWGEHDEEEWWYGETGFKPSLYPYTDEGCVAPGITEVHLANYYKERREWWAAHRMPVILVNYQSGDCPKWVLAVPGSIRSTEWGAVEHILPLPTVTYDQTGAFARFCADHRIALPHDPKWLLLAHWG